jgi:hypothetical protein
VSVSISPEGAVLAGLDEARRSSGAEMEGRIRPLAAALRELAEERACGEIAHAADRLERARTGEELARLHSALAWLLKRARA